MPTWVSVCCGNCAKYSIQELHRGGWDMSKEEVFVRAMFDLKLDSAQIRGIISHLRTLGYTNEPQYSGMNTALSETSGTVRVDGSETIELARGMISREY